MVARLRHRSPAEFAGYKVGMTHVTVSDNKPTSPTKDKEIVVPVTVLECPPLKVFGIRAYDKGVAVSQTIAEQLDKNLGRRLTTPKKRPQLNEDADEYRLIVHTQPALTAIGKKKPELFELPLEGSKDEQLAKAKELVGRELKVTDILSAGQQVDVHAVTTGKGTQGPVKRFGIGIRQHKSEKTKRGPGSLGPWKGQGHIMHRIAYAGQTGFQQRTEYNKWIVSIGDDPKRINPKGGFLRYGLVKNPYILVKGSVPGPSKRLLRLSAACRPDKRVPNEPPQLIYTSLESKQ
jgi:large subunit ribosomal protein L3